MPVDPVCKMTVDEDSPFKAEVGSRMYYFCSQDCLATFTSPEKELKSMKRRITAALVYLGLLAVPADRAGAVHRRLAIA